MFRADKDESAENKFKELFHAATRLNHELTAAPHLVPIAEMVLARVFRVALPRLLELELVFALTVCHLLLRASLLQELCISRAMRR